MSRRGKTGSLLPLAVGVAGAAAIHRATHGTRFTRQAAVAWPAHAEARAGVWVSWNRIPIGAGIKGFSGHRPDDVWAWASSGIMHWDGRAWTRVPGPGHELGRIDGVSEWYGTLWVRTAVDIPLQHLGCDSWGGYTERHNWCRVGTTWKKDDGCDIRRPGETQAPVPPSPPPDGA